MTNPNRAAVGLAVLMLGASAAALPRYSGSAVLFGAFAISFTTLVLLAVPKPRLYVYTFFVALLSLGLWAKTIVHIFWALPFIEPTGDFANTAAEWDAAVGAMTSAALGVAMARCAHLWYRRTRPAAHVLQPAPTWLPRWRKAIWLLTLAILAVVNLANLHFAFIQVGINPKLLLPFRLHVLLSWLVNLGLALWIAALVWWEYLALPGSLSRTLLVPIVEAFTSSVSSFSRIAYLVHGLPYWLAGCEERRIRTAIGRRGLALLTACFILFFALAIVAVFWLRLHYYPQLDRTTGRVSQNSVGQQMAVEIPQLAMSRWMGLEGILTVGALQNRGTAAFVEALSDSPRSGIESVFRKASKIKPYLVDPANFTFHTNAGPVAILFFSGSLCVVFGGMALIGFVLIFTEEGVLHFTANPFLVAVAGASLANVFVQITFFYLMLVFLLQTWATVAAIALIPRVRISSA